MQRHVLQQTGVAHCLSGLQGAQVSFRIQAGEGATVPSDAELEVYTTRPDTLFGVTYMVVAPEHPLLSQITTPGQQSEVDAYVQKAGGMSDLERTELQKSKTGIFTGEASCGVAAAGFAARTGLPGRFAWAKLVQTSCFPCAAALCRQHWPLLHVKHQLRQLCYNSCMCNASLSPQGIVMLWGHTTCASQPCSNLPHYVCQSLAICLLYIRVCQSMAAICQGQVHGLQALQEPMASQGTEPWQECVFVLATIRVCLIHWAVHDEMNDGLQAAMP